MTEPRDARSGVLTRIEDYALVGLVGLLVALAGLQIVLRLAFESGIVWADALLRHLVLWTALLGAMTAARENKHLAIDAISSHLGPRAQGALRALTHGFACAICLALAWYSFDLIRVERSDAARAFGAVPAWIGETIMPVAFAVMAWRYARHAVRGAIAAFRSGTPA
jgi:TRAP-type C4-dicarboxylate transport system permease small subunit